jgi:hypothetical protein
MPWSTAATATSPASTEAVWACYRTADSWTAWDDGLDAVTFNGELATGATGTLRPSGGPALGFTVVHCEPGRAFEDVTPIPHRLLPLAAVRFRHTLSPLPTGGCEITHRVEIGGPLGALFARLMGPGFAEGLPKTVRALADYAAAHATPAHV